jgi:hypothetical protein
MSVSKSATGPVPTKAPTSVPWAGASDDPSGVPASEAAPPPEEEEEVPDAPEELALPEPELPLDDVLLPEEEEDDAPEEEEDELPDDELLAVDASAAPPEPDPPDVPEEPQGDWEPVVDPQAAQNAPQTMERTSRDVEGRTGTR